MTQFFGDEFSWHRRHQSQVGISVVDAPSVEPVSLDQLRAQCRIDENSDQDGLLPVFISAARERAENYCNRSFAQQTKMMSLDRFPCHPNIIYLRRPPVASIVSVTYLDPTTGSRTAVDPSTYTCDFDTVAPRLFLAPTPGVSYCPSWPTALHEPGSIQITYTTGTPAIPASVVHAILLMASDAYSNRDAQVGVPLVPNATVVALLSPYRVFEASY